MGQTAFSVYTGEAEHSSGLEGRLEHAENRPVARRQHRPRLRLSGLSITSLVDAHPTFQKHMITLSHYHNENVAAHLWPHQKAAWLVGLILLVSLDENKLMVMCTHLLVSNCVDLEFTQNF